MVAGAADLNVRNSPARIMPNRMTPLPKSLEPLVVQGWSYNADFQPVKTPEYQVTVLAPETAGTGPRGAAAGVLGAASTGSVRGSGLRATAAIGWCRAHATIATTQHSASTRPIYIS